jgi:5-hydroxyisourate hydrolase
MSGISTHVLDTARGVPAAGIAVTLELVGAGDDGRVLATAATDADGRVRALLPPGSPLAAGTYRLTFDTEAYFLAQRTAAFYPTVVVSFRVQDVSKPHHVPLLLSPFGYSTYRGS